MRILQLSWEYPPLVYGGLGRHVHALARAEASLGHDVTVLTQSVAGAPADSDVDGVRVLRVDLHPPVPPDDLLGWVLALGHGVARAGLRLGTDAGSHKTAPQVVHAHDWVMAHAGVLLAEARRVPLVATVHATERGRHQGWLPTPLSTTIDATERWLVRESAAVITCSLATAEEVRRLQDGAQPGGAACPVEVLPNGIDLRQWSRPSPAARARARAAHVAGPADGPLVVFAGRLEFEKGVHTLLDAMPRLRRRYPGLRLAVAGHGTYAGELARRARDLRLGRAVTFTGFLADRELAALLAAADVTVLPSLYEPFGMVALEAAALGVPRAVAGTGGLGELVEPGVTGLRFAAGDPGALADAVDALLRDPVASARMARAARAAAARDHRWPDIARRTVEVYERARAARD